MGSLPKRIGALNTAHLDDEPAKEALDEYEDALGAPASDPIRFGSEPILEAIR